jgi:hypothetical protein
MPEKGQEADPQLWHLRNGKALRQRVAAFHRSGEESGNDRWRLSQPAGDLSIDQRQSRRRDDAPPRRDQKCAGAVLAVPWSDQVARAEELDAAAARDGDAPAEQPIEHEKPDFVTGRWGCARDIAAAELQERCRDGPLEVASKPNVDTFQEVRVSRQ